MIPPALLDTVVVGPRVDGPRGLLAAVAFYAAHPAARARPGRLDRALWGVGATLQAARHVVEDRRLRRAALLPTALTVAGCALLALLATAAADPDERGAGTTFQAFLVAFVGLASLPPTVLQRLWLRVAHEARRALGQPSGEDPFPGEGLAAMLWREGWKALRQAAVVSFGLLPLLVVVRLLPFGAQEAAWLAGAWAFYWVVVDAFELPVEVVPGPRRAAAEPWFSRLHRRAGAWARPLRPAAWLGRALARLTGPWHQEVELTERHRWEAAGFGLTVGALLLVPVAGLFFRAVAITAATALLGRLEGGSAPGAEEAPLGAEPGVAGRAGAADQAPRPGTAATS